MNRVSIYNNLEDLPIVYGNIFREASVASGFFLSYPWFHNLIATTFAKNTQLRIFSLADELDCNRPCLALLMCYQDNKGGLLTPRKLSSAANYYTSMFGMIKAKSTSELETDLTFLTQAIVSDQPRWDIVDLHPMDVTDPLFNLTQRAFRQAGMAVQSYFCFGNWYLEVQGRSYQAYFDSLPSKLKNTLIRKLKKQTYTNKISLEIFSGMDNLDVGIASFIQVYNTSWKKPEPHTAFIPGLIRTCAEQGWLRLGIASIGGQPVAAQIWIVSNNVASIYKLAYDKHFSKLSVGTILTAYLMQHVIDIDKVEEVDYLTGDDDYKKDWMSLRRERWGIVAFNLRTLSGVLSAIKHLGWRRVKRYFSAKIHHD